MEHPNIYSWFLYNFLSIWHLTNFVSIFCVGYYIYFCIGNNMLFFLDSLSSDTFFFHFFSYKNLQARHVFLLLCQFVNHMEVVRLPVYYPSQQEKEDPKLYANNVRKLIAMEVG